MTAFPLGKAQLRREGRSGLAILAFGALVDSAQKIAERLDATLVNMRFVKPLDEKMVMSIAERHQAIITIEENAIIGGAGAGVGELLAAAGLHCRCCTSAFPTCLSNMAPVTPASPVRAWILRG